MGDKTLAVRELAKQKSENTLQKALYAINELHKKGDKITFYSVYTKAKISKSFVYNNKTVKDVIESYRDKSNAISYKTDPKDVIIAMQKQEIKTLSKLAFGYSEMKCKIDELTIENMELKKQLKKSYEY